MVNSSRNQCIPDYLVTPGEILEEYLDAHGMSQAELAARTGMAKKTINEIIRGKASITPDTALKLERALGRPAHFWSNLERQFQEDRIRMAEKQRLEAHPGWLRKIPVNAMVKHRWLTKRKEIFIETNGLDGEKEEEADAFGRDKLIPPDELHRFLQHWNQSNEEIAAFADRIGIAPGIVVGRFQHDRLLPNSHGNKLKVYYCWTSEEAA